MAYPFYNNYTPYYPYQQMPIQQNVQQPTVQQPIQQPVQPMIQPSPTSLIWIDSEKSAALYPVAPNNAVALWNQNEPVVYLKQADASGKPTLKTYDLVERSDAPVDGSKSEGVKDMPYATKEDLAALAGVVKGFDGMIASIKGDVDKMNETLYGLSGKKKSTKKAESEEESE